jgi:hypothetical protein
MGMERSELLELVDLLGQELERRGRSADLESLRLYYFALIRDERGPTPWSADLVIEWLAQLLPAPLEKNVRRIRIETSKG